VPFSSGRLQRPFSWPLQLPSSSRPRPPLSSWRPRLLSSWPLRLPFSWRPRRLVSSPLQRPLSWPLLRLFSWLLPRPSSWRCRPSLGGFGSLGSVLGFFRLGGFASLLGLLSGVGLLLFRGLHGLLLDLLLLQLLDLSLARSGFLRFPGNLLIGLGGRLALGLELVQGSLNDRLGRRQFRRHGETDEQHGKHQHMQANGPDTGPEVAFRGGWLSLLHQGASVIRPTLPTPAFCNPPMAPMTAP